MATRSQKVRVGVFTAVVGAVAAVVLVAFGGMRFWEKKHHYTIVFDDTVYGLDRGSLVFLNGIKVGSVKSIEPAPEDLRKVRVSIEVKADAPIHRDTKAMLQLAGITGLRIIDLQGGTYAAETLPDGAQIQTGKTLIDRLQLRAEQLVDQSGEIMAKASKIADNVATLTDPKQFEGVHEIIANTKTATGNLVTMSETLTASAAESRVALKQTLVHVNGSIDQLDATVASVGETARTATQKLNGQVSQVLDNANELVVGMKGVVVRNGQVLTNTLADLRQASRSFKELAREIRQKPSRLFFGESVSERKLP